MNGNTYTQLTCDLGQGMRTYLFTGDTSFSKLEAREVDDKGNVISVGGGISVPTAEFKQLLRHSKPYQSTYVTQGT